MQWELLQRSMHALFLLFWSNTRSRGLSIRCSEVFWKLPKNNKLSVLEVVKLGKSYNWLVQQPFQYMWYININVYITNIIYRCMWYTYVYNMYSTHISYHMQQSTITQFLSQWPEELFFASDKIKNWNSSFFTASISVFYLNWTIFITLSQAGSKWYYGSFFKFWKIWDLTLEKKKKNQGRIPTTR